nr:hypothetical protein [Beijerinckia sp. L45]
MKHRQADVDLLLAARGVQNAPTAGPIFDRFAVKQIVLGLIDHNADGAIQHRSARFKQVKRVANLGIDAIGGHDEIRFDHAPIGKTKLSIWANACRFRARYDLTTELPSRFS